MKIRPSRIALIKSFWKSGTFYKNICPKDVASTCTSHLSLRDLYFVICNFIFCHFLARFYDEVTIALSPIYFYSKNSFSLFLIKKSQPSIQLSLVNSGISPGKLSSIWTVSFNFVKSPSLKISHITKESPG